MSAGRGKESPVDSRADCVFAAPQRKVSSGPNAGHHPISVLLSIVVPEALPKEPGLHSSSRN
jgi:hypothetical protein